MGVGGGRGERERERERERGMYHIAILKYFPGTQPGVHKRTWKMLFETMIFLALNYFLYHQPNPPCAAQFPCSSFGLNSFLQINSVDYNHKCILLLINVLSHSTRA